MAFMQPFYSNAPFHVVTTTRGETHAIPADVFGTAERVAEEYETTADNVETVRGKWFCRLSAPGYMDCTEWDGPYDSQEEARQAIRDYYNADPDTGDDLDDCEEC